MMKKYCKYLILLCIILGNVQVGLSRINKPTIKIGVFYTPAAVGKSGGQPINNYIDTNIATLKTLMANNLLSTTYEVDVTEKTLLPTYVEPKHRPGPNQYLSIPGNGTDQVFSEIMLQGDFVSYYTSVEDDNDDIPGTLDDDLNTNVLNENEIDKFFVHLQESVKPDVIFLIVDESGDPMVIDGAINDAQAGYDEPLYVVLSADYFFSDEEAMAYGFFRLFCDYGYSDADLGSDDPGVYSFLSDYWTGVEGTDYLSDTNVELFKHNVGKLKLATVNSGQVVFNGTTDLTFQYSQSIQDVNGATAIVFDGSNQDFAIAIPQAAFANEGNSTTDIYGDEVKITNSFRAFTSGEYTVDPTQVTDPRTDNTPSTTPYIPPSISLPIGFDHDITEGNKNQYISSYFGADNEVLTNNGSEDANGKYLSVTKFAGESNKWATTTISNVSNLIFSPSGSKKLKMDVYSPNATTDVMLILENEQDRVTKEYITNDLAVNGWKELVFDFGNSTNRTGNVLEDVNYDKISIQFNNLTTESSSKTYRIDNLSFAASGPDVYFSYSKVYDPTSKQEKTKPKHGDQVTFQFNVKTKSGTASDVEVKVPLPTGYIYKSHRTEVGSSPISTASYDKSSGRWLINSLSSDKAEKLFVTAEVKSYGKHNYQGKIVYPDDSDISNNVRVINVNPEIGYDFEIALVNDPYQDTPCPGPKQKLDFKFLVTKDKQLNYDIERVVVQFDLNNYYKVVGTIPSQTFTNNSLTNGDVWNAAGSRWTIANFGKDVLEKEITLKVEFGNTIPNKESPLVATILDGDNKEIRQDNNSREVIFNKGASLVFTKPSELETELIYENQQVSFEFIIKNEGNCVAKDIEFVADIDNRVFSNFKIDGKGSTTLETTTGVNKERFSLSEDLMPGETLSKALTMTYLGGGFGERRDYEIYSPYSNTNYLDENGGQYWTRQLTARGVSFDSEVSTKDNNDIADSPDGITLYPNPFTNTFRVVYEQAEGATSGTVVARVYDFSGRTVLIKQFRTDPSVMKHELEIDGSSLPVGPYIIEVDNGISKPQHTTLIRN